MKAIKFLKLMGAALLLSGLTITNAMAASSTGTSEALMIEPITIENFLALSFGAFVPSGAIGKVIIDDTNGTRSSTNGIQLLSSNVGGSGLFFVAGEDSRTFNTVVDSTVTLTGPGADMIATLTFTSNSPLNGLGASEVIVGGELDVAADQAGGNYTGTYNVTVDY